MKSKKTPIERIKEKLFGLGLSPKIIKDIFKKD